MSIQVLLDREIPEELINKLFEGIMFEDLVKSNNQFNNLINEEESGSNYFLVGGPYKNYA